MSKIEWTDRTFNPVTGCTKCSEACQNCYAEVMAKRLQAMGQHKYKNGFNLTLHPETLQDPLKWKKPCMIFVCSMSDLFHDDVPIEFIDKVMDTIRQTPQHIYQILTKRPLRMREYALTHNIPKNVWMGVTVESSDYKQRIRILQGISFISVRFISFEPLLDEIEDLDFTGIDWVIVGGENGANARYMNPEWVYNILRQCREQNVPFFFKGWGARSKTGKINLKRVKDPFIDGQIIREMPLIYERSR